MGYTIGIWQAFRAMYKCFFVVLSCFFHVLCAIMWALSALPRRKGIPYIIFIRWCEQRLSHQNNSLPVQLSLVKTSLTWREVNPYTAYFGQTETETINPQPACNVPVMIMITIRNRNTSIKQLIYKWDDLFYTLFLINYTRSFVVCYMFAVDSCYSAVPAMGCFCEYEVWFMFCISYNSAAWNVMSYWTALDWHPMYLFTQIRQGCVVVIRKLYDCFNDSEETLKDMVKLIGTKPQQNAIKWRKLCA